MGSSASGCQAASAGCLLIVGWAQVCSSGVQAGETVLGYVVMVSDPKRRPLCWFGLPQAELEIGLGSSELCKVVSESTSEGVQSETKKRENGKPPMNPWTGFSTRRSIIED